MGRTLPSTLTALVALPGGACAPLVGNDVVGTSDGSW